MIIDVHAHCGRWFFPSSCEDPVKVSKLCDVFGINRAVFSSSRAILYDMQSGNRETSNFIMQDDRFYGYVYLNPVQYEDSQHELETYLKVPKFVGVKLHPSYSGQPANSPATIKLLESLPKDKVVLIHAWGPAGVNQVSEVASVLPELSIIMGHMGGTAENDWRSGIEAAEKHGNIYLEICGTVLQYDRIAEAAKRVGSEKILYGSDLTLINPAFSIGQVLDSGLTEEEKQRVLGKNAAELFNFQKSEVDWP